MIKQIYSYIDEREARSAWNKGVKAYAVEMMGNTASSLIVTADTAEQIEKALLNGAEDWHQSSWGGCYAVYDGDIAKQLCTPSELKRNRNGELNPNSREQWLDVQARALHQAYRLIVSAWRYAKRNQKEETYYCIDDDSESTKAELLADWNDWDDTADDNANKKEAFAEWLDACQAENGGSLIKEK